MKYVILMILSIMLCFPLLAEAEETSLRFGPFGEVSLYRPPAPPAQVVLFVSGDGGWNKGVVDMARALTGLNALVVGIDINVYLDNLGKSASHCAYSAADFEALSKFVQKKIGYPQYTIPILVGYSSGATLVYAVLAQAPPNTFAGAISLGFCPDLTLEKPLCQANGLRWQKGPKKNSYLFMPTETLTETWVAFQGTIDQVCDADATAAFVRQVKNGRIVLLPKVGHGFSVQRNWMPQFKQVFSELGKQQKESGPQSSIELGGLPLVEVSASGEATKLLAVFISGDGGWAGLDRTVSGQLAERGIPVVGLNSLKYFWTPRTPDETAKDLERILHDYLQRWSKEKVVLIGYSLGADVIPFAATRLPKDLKDRIALVVLIGPSARANFEFHLSDWLGGSSEEGLPTLPEAEKLKGTPLLCFFGTEEDDSICPKLNQEGCRSIVLEGGHHYGGNYDPIVEAIIKEVNRTTP